MNEKGLEWITALKELIELTLEDREDEITDDLKKRLLNKRTKGAATQYYDRLIRKGLV
jgi:ribosomal protein L29